jgi:hypothetical protein
MSKVFQEFYCGNCQGYISVRLNMELNRVVEVVCPNCEHKHKRCIKDGQIFERGRENNSPLEEICPPKSAYYKTAKTSKMLNAKGFNQRRDGVIFEEKQPVERPFLLGRWFERFGGGYDSAQE